MNAPLSGLRWGRFCATAKWIKINFFSCSYIYSEQEKMFFMFIWLYRGPIQWKLLRDKVLFNTKNWNILNAYFHQIFLQKKTLKRSKLWIFSTIVGKSHFKVKSKQTNCVNEFLLFKICFFSFFYNFSNYSWLHEPTILFFAFIYYPGCGQQFDMVAKCRRPLKVGVIGQNVPVSRYLVLLEIQFFLVKI